MKTPTTIQQIESIEAEINALYHKVEILQLEKDQLKREQQAETYNRVRSRLTNKIVQQAASKDWRCKECGALNNGDSTYCTYCGNDK